jgi:SAM-dependent methyltransferase
MALGHQTWLWSAGFVLLALLVALCGLAVQRGGVTPYAEGPAEAVTWRQRGRWTLLAFVASGLLLSTTTHLTTDIAAMPLLWVIPLGVYLISFILAFGDNGPRWTRLAQQAAPVALLTIGVWACLKFGPQGSVALAVAGILLLFIIALALHGTLALEKPSAAALTDFYLWISVGGALGGVLCALVAPALFDWPYEHPLLLVAAAAFIPSSALRPRFAPLFAGKTLRRLVAVAALLAGLGAGWMVSQMEAAPLPAAVTTAIFSVVILIWLAAFVAIGRPALFAALFAALLLSLGGVGQLRRSARDGARERSFFGVYTVMDQVPQRRRLLFHGTTIHGLQSLAPETALIPMSYYAPPSGVGLALAAAPRLFGPDARIAFVGLGAGTLACHARPGQQWTAYEIDPVVVTIARRNFSYLKGCRPDLPIVLGDARLTLQKAPAGAYDLLAVDAFSSDSIPLHLVTREAFAIYGRALQPDGVLLIHISNNFLELEPMITAIARAEGWTVRTRLYKPPERQPKGQLYTQSHWMALTRTPEVMARLEAATPAGSWQPAAEREDLAPWTDDFASILPVIKAPF